MQGCRKNNSELGFETAYAWFENEHLIEQLFYYVIVKNDFLGNNVRDVCDKIDLFALHR
jgi:hypothetical protein